MNLVNPIFEFGRGFYGNAYTPVLSSLTLTPGPLQIFVTASDGKLGGAWERGPKELGLMNVNFWITLVIETSIFAV